MSGATAKRQRKIESTMYRPETAPDRKGAVRDVPAYDEERVARLAYFFWEARGCQGGSPEEDWFRAERELNANR
jgi:hypothetical protein